MSLPHCSSNSIYQTSAKQKLDSQRSARQFCNKTPKVHMLREKCKQRIQEARQKRFDSTRNTKDEDERSLIINILHEEISEMDSDIALEDEILEELRDEMGEWYIKQVEEEDDYLTNVLDDYMFCPLCLKSCVEQFDDQLFKCECGAMFKYNGKLPEIQMRVVRAVNTHGTMCREDLNFFVDKISGSLNAMCKSCNYFIQFI